MTFSHLDDTDYNLYALAHISHFHTVYNRLRYRAEEHQQREVGDKLSFEF
jgi:hypothetical protein